MNSNYKNKFCPYCGKEILKKEDRNIDHIITKKLFSGIEIPKVLCCKICNTEFSKYEAEFANIFFLSMGINDVPKNAKKAFFNRMKYDLKKTQSVLDSVKYRFFNDQVQPFFTPPPKEVESIKIVTEKFLAAFACLFLKKEGKTKDLILHIPTQQGLLMSNNYDEYYKKQIKITKLKEKKWCYWWEEDNLIITSCKIINGDGDIIGSIVEMLLYDRFVLHGLIFNTINQKEKFIKEKNDQGNII